MTVPWHLVPAFQPARAEGVYFRRESLDYYDKLPRGHQAMFGACWFDNTTDAQVGSMCHAVIEMDHARRFYVTELWHGRTDIDSAIQAMVQLQEAMHRVQLWADPSPQKNITYGPKRWFIEQGQFASGVGTKINERRVQLNRRIQDPRAWFRMSAAPLKQQEGKAFSIETAARSLQADLISRTLLLPRRAPWLGALEAELMMWPATPSSSRVAALGLLTSARLLIHPAHARPAIGKEPSSSWMAQ